MSLEITFYWAGIILTAAFLVELVIIFLVKHYVRDSATAVSVMPEMLDEMREMKEHLAGLNEFIESTVNPTKDVVAAIVGRLDTMAGLIGDVTGIAGKLTGKAGKLAEELGSPVGQAKLAVADLVSAKVQQLKATMLAAVPGGNIMAAMSNRQKTNEAPAADDSNGQAQ